jgi:hypothetical protein
MDMKSYCYRQVEEAKRYKWIQSQKAGKDLGEAAIHDWVKKYAALYRKDYNEQYLAMVCCVVEETIKELDKAKVNVDKELVERIVKISINKFTEKWVTEVSKEEHKGQIETI